jgi:aminoglycoside phosphotransferase (APT) family kinase protein
MLELTETNLLDYLGRNGWLAPGPARVELLGGGVSNVVLRVGSAAGAVIVKQSRPRLRTRDAWFSDLDRIFRELEVIQVLHQLLPENVPAVLFVDRVNYAFGMSAAPAGAAVWKARLLAGDVDLGLGERVGTLLGTMHEATGEKTALVEPFRDTTYFVQLRVEPFYRRVQERRPEVASAIERLILQMLTVKEALCHGDYTPKNLLVDGSSLTLVDYETAHFGDPTMDLGLFLAHVLLKSLHRPDLGRRYFDLTRAFWRGYTARAHFRPAPELGARSIAHCGACVLARVDGTSPVDYLAEPARLAARRLGIDLLQQCPPRWDDVLDRTTKELESL